MAWIELHQPLIRHPKTLHLTELLRVKRQLVIGHLATLWCWALDAAPDGGPLTARDLKAGAEWDGDAQRFAEALAEARFLDRIEGDRFMLHDWHEYAGRLVAKRRSNAERQRQFRERERTRNALRNANITVTSASRNGATVPNPTEQNLTSSSSGTLTAAPAREEREEQDRAKEDDDGAASSLEQKAEQRDGDAESRREAYALLQTDLAAWHGSKTIRDLMADFAQDLTWPVVLEAMRRTIKGSPGRVWSYCERILKQWVAAGVHDLAAIMALDQRHEERKAVQREVRRGHQEAAVGASGAGTPPLRPVISAEDVERVRAQIEKEAELTPEEQAVARETIERVRQRRRALQATGPPAAGEPGGDRGPPSGGRNA